MRGKERTPEGAFPRVEAHMCSESLRPSLSCRAPLRPALTLAQQCPGRREAARAPRGVVTVALPGPRAASLRQAQPMPGPSQAAGEAPLGQRHPPPPPTPPPHPPAPVQPLPVRRSLPDVCPASPFFQPPEEPDPLPPAGPESSGGLGGKIPCPVSSLKPQEDLVSADPVLSRKKREKGGR